MKETSMPAIYDQLAHPLSVKDSSSVVLDSSDCPVAVTELRCATESRMYWGASMRFRMSLTGSGAQPLLSSVTIQGSKRRTRRPLVSSSHDPAARTFFTQSLCAP